MKDSPIIKSIEITRFSYPVENVAVDPNYSMPVYTPGAKTTPTATVVQIHTDQGISGEFLDGTEPALTQLKMMSSWLIGQNALEREHIYNHMKRALRHFDMSGIGLVDICLWDIAGKFFNAPLYQLLGGKKRPLPAYASTMHPDDNGGLSTPEDMSDFAQQCVEMGYPAYKMHVWGNIISREVETVLAVRDRVGDGIHLLLDPASQYPTFGNAVTVGRACDEANYYWLEDPYRDGGLAHTGHQRLRELIKTPLLQTEHVRLLEQTVNFITAGATDFVRAGAHEDGGVTGAMKIAHASEGFGLDMELHGPGPVHRHIMTSVRNTNFYELGLVHPGVKTNRPPVYIDYSDDLDAIDSEGNVHAPDGPGIGVDIDWDYIRRNEIDSVVWD